jgi:hypothetical protein
VKSPSTSTRPRFTGQSAQRTIPCARGRCLPVPRGGKPGKQTLVRPIHVHNSAYFFSRLILLLLPAFSVVSRRGLPQPSCKHGVARARTFGHGGFASIGSLPSPLGPKRPSRRKSFRLNRVGRANRLGLSGRQETAWMIESRPPSRMWRADWRPHRWWIGRGHAVNFRNAAFSNAPPRARGGSPGPIRFLVAGRFGWLR